MIRAIVTDIEGTTSSLSFVKDVLFPYARRHMEVFVRRHQQDPQVASLLAEVRQLAGHTALALDDVIAQLIQWIDQDKKVTPLKALQGLIWEQGYTHGDFHGHVYADAVEQLRRWHAAGVQLYVYSSGSVYAQKLLFAHTEFGDLTPLFTGYFDTNIGAKQDTTSYQKIARAIGIEPAEILFLSDIQTELDAARQAGMQIKLLVREGANRQQSSPGAVADFYEIVINSATSQ
jgi:enolase-phosphatase E1